MNKCKRSVSSGASALCDDRVLHCVVMVQVLERIKEPLKSVIGRDEPAITYAVLAHVLLLAQRAPIIFENDYATFFCRAHDPW